MQRSNNHPNLRFFASCIPGCETPLHQEMKALRFSRVEKQVGGVAFSGQPAEGWRAVFNLRTAVRVYRELLRFSVEDGDALYKGASEVDWTEVISADNTFAVDARVSENEKITHSGFAALKVKDAIVDKMRKLTGTRPSVDTDSPDARIFLLLNKNRAILSLDLGGRSLHRRGYRKVSVEAPISECIAASAIALSEWDGRAPLLDPMCGSGTILIEGAMKAANIAPGLIAGDYSFERLPGFDGNGYGRIVDKAKSLVSKPKKLIILGSDRNPGAVKVAKENADKAIVGDMIDFEVADVRDFAPRKGWGATLISNPPYGIRLEEEEALIPFYEELGELFLKRCSGYAVHLFITSKKHSKALKLKPEHYWPFAHGGLNARLYRYLIL